MARRLLHSGDWVKRFTAKFDTTKTGCWFWSGFIDHNGYGVASGSGGTAYELFGERAAHRISWILYKGPIPNGLQVLHRCDVRECVNPGHLFLGTNADNVADRNAKGRTARNCGEKHGRSKLTWEQVKEIRKTAVSLKAMRKTRAVPYTKLAKKYEVSRSQIWFVVSGKNWKEQ